MPYAHGTLHCHKHMRVPTFTPRAKFMYASIRQTVVLNACNAHCSVDYSLTSNNLVIGELNSRHGAGRKGTLSKS